MTQSTLYFGFYQEIFDFAILLIFFLQIAYYFYASTSGTGESLIPQRNGMNIKYKQYCPIYDLSFQNRIAIDADNQVRTQFIK